MRISISAIFILLINVQTLWSQNSFEFERLSDKDEFPLVVVEDDEENIYTSISSDNSFLLLKLDKQGNCIQEVNIDNPNGNCVISCLLLLDNELIGLGEFGINSVRALWFVRLDYDLNILDDKKNVDFRLDGYGIKAIINHNDNIVLVADIDSILKPSTNVIIELTKSGDVLRSRFLNFFGMINTIYDIIQDPKSYNYKLFPYNQFTGKSGIITNVDTTFEIINQLSLFPTIQDQNSAEWISSERYLLTSKYVPATNKCKLCIVKNTYKDKIIGSKCIFSSNSIEYPAINRNLSVKYSNCVYYSGMSGNYWPDPFNDNYNEIAVNRLDSSLVLIWKMFFGGDACYFTTYVEATLDSGVLVASSKYNSNLGNWLRNVYILKVDKNGLITSNPECNVHDTGFSIYPNPGLNFISIQTIISPSIFELLSLNGQLLIKQQLHENHSIINTSILKSGVYVYRISDNQGKLIKSGKWIKY